MSDDPVLAARVLDAWGLAGSRLRPWGAGLINRTWLVEADGGHRYALQKLHPIFTARLHEDIEAVTAHLARKGVTVPRLVRTRGGALCTEGEAGLWRLLTWVDGISRDALGSPAEARAAGALLGRFHLAVADLEHAFVAARLGVHDTARHLRVLGDALVEHAGHPRHAQVAQLAAAILEAAAALPDLPVLPDRTVHGDPKISNLLFDPATGGGLCLVDLDTLSRMPLPLELGDAFRSWCNPRGEDRRDAHFDLALFAAAIDGYAAVTRGWLSEPEWRAIVPATRTICVELAARFCADALRESYFGWDPARFATRGEHNAVRAAGQLAEALALAAVADEAARIVARAYAGTA